MSEKTYNGFSNYETATLSLWIDDTKTSYDYWREEALKHWRTAATCEDVKTGQWTRDEVAKREVADQLKDELSDSSPLKDNTVYADLLNAALSEVDWYEVAEHLLADAQEREESDDLFGPVISTYSRAQAIADGVLIDVSQMAEKAGIKYPTAVTSAVWHEFVEVPEGVDGQDELGRLWDIFNMFRVAAKCPNGSTELLFEVVVKNDNTAPKLVNLKAIFGPGDTPDPVITIMQPDED